MNTNNKKQDACNNAHQFCIPSEHTLHACGNPYYNVLPSNMQVCPCPCCGTPDEDDTDRRLDEHEERIKTIETTLEWVDLDEEDSEEVDTELNINDLTD